MAQLQQYIDLNLNKQAVLSAKIYPLTSAARTALTLVAGDAGLLVYDTTLNSLQAWNGTAWQNANPTGAGGMAFKGTIAANAAQPGSPVAGDMYVFSSAGTTSWTPAATVVIGDAVVYDGTVWNYLEKNASTASNSVEGIIQLATQAEVNAGTQPSKALTPATIGSIVPDSATTLRLSRRYRINGLSLVANTALNIVHNLGLATASECQVAVYQGGAEIQVAVTPVDANNLTITSNVSLATVTVTVLG